MDAKLVPEDHPILQTRCTDWDFENPSQDMNLLILNMINVMREEGGMGLSANQIGIDARVFIMETDNKVAAYINPEIVAASGEVILDDEGCLSFPDLRMKIKRPSSISVRYQDLSGNIVEEDLTDLNARCFSHETDHLNGVRFTERASKLVVDMAKKRRSKK